jgi:Zn-dependent protease
LPQTALVIAVFEFVLLIFSLSVHECAHAWMASRLGDQTARLQGRITLNPMYHVDPIGTLLLPGLAIFGPFIGFGFLRGFLFGWAKPTPVITRNFKKIVRDDNLVTLAGPASNLLIVLVAFLFLAGVSLAVPGGHDLVLSTFVGIQSPGLPAGLGALVVLAVLAVEINLSLFFFNLLPIPPLDGSRIVRNMLPYKAMQAYDNFSGLFGLLLMLVVGRVLMGLVLGPSLAVIYFALSSLHGS